MTAATRQDKSGFSLVEVVVSIAVMGVIASVAVVAIGRVTTASREAVAQNVVAKLNNATKEFGHAQWELYSGVEDNSADDERHLLQTLQWQDPSIEIGVAGPFMRTDWIPQSSDQPDDYRIIWTGSYWRLAVPGENGVGLKVDFESRDMATHYIHPDDFQPVNPTASNLGNPTLSQVDDGDLAPGESEPVDGDPIPVSLGGGTPDSGTPAEVGVITTSLDPTVQAVELAVGETVGDRVEEQSILYGVPAEIVVEITGDIPAEYADTAAAVFSVALFGEAGTSSSYTQSVFREGDTIRLTAAVPMGGGGVMTATLSITPARRFRNPRFRCGYRRPGGGIHG